MKHLKYLILEKVSIEDIYQKYYSDIDFDEFTEIVKSDPTHIEGKRNGRYIQWLLKLYKNKNLRLEDLYKATEYLELFDKQSVKNKLSQKDIFKYSSLQELFKAIEPFKYSPEIESKTDVLDKTFIKEFKNFNLYIPKSYEDSCILGSGTEWCTATGKTSIHYDNYSEKGKLYILISKTNPKEKYQINLESDEFMDVDDNELDRQIFFHNNRDILKYLDLAAIDDKIIVSNKIKKLYCHGEELKSLSGIEKLTNLTTLSCYNNEITSLSGIENLTNLKTIYCDNNKLTSLLEVKNLINLEVLICDNNKLTSLTGIENLTNLKELYCNDNQLTSIDGIENLTNLETLYCNDNKLTSIDGIENLTNLETLYYHANKLPKNYDNLSIKEIQQKLKNGKLK